MKKKQKKEEKTENEWRPEKQTAGVQSERKGENKKTKRAKRSL